ncbi:hypothetical protein ACLOJK_036032 [Asimina triloba]
MKWMTLTIRRHLTQQLAVASTTLDPIGKTTVAITGVTNKAMINHDRWRLLPQMAEDRKPQVVDDDPILKAEEEGVGGFREGKITGKSSSCFSQPETDPICTSVRVEPE